MLRGEADAVAGSAVRVWSAAGEVVGAGFVAGPDTIATCAHVVAEALGADPYAPSPPAGAVRVDLPLLGESTRLTGVVSRWLPIGQDGTGDVALLRVREPLPVGSRMPPLRRADQVWDRPFRALGFPDGAWDGVWSSGLLRAGQGTGWVQLQSDTGAQPVVGGFSGSAVWDSAAGAVIGMTVAADRSGTTTAYLVPIQQVLGLDPDLLPCPYQGLAPFTEAQAAYFFGRDADIERLVAAVEREPIVALAGPSGAGKSSLLRAGLVPRLRRAGAQIVELQPGATVDDFEPDGTDQVLVLDQFEEVATRDPRQARALLEDVVRLTGSGSVRAVLTVRGAALDELLTPTLAQVLDAGTLHVAPLDRTNLRETIVRPAERAPGLDFEPGLVDRILDDAGSEPGQLPLVESLLADLWRRREGGRLTWRGYTEAGGVIGAVAQHAERVVAELAAATPDPQFHDRLRRLFAQLAAPDRGGRFVRVPVRTAALPPEERALVPQLAAGRLLVVGRDAFDVEVVELAHQALIEHWPRLRDWLEQDRAFLAWRAQTDQQRERWEAAGRDDGALLRGSSLVAAGEWVPARDAEVAPETRDFVARSTTYQRRTTRRLRAATALFAVLALAAGLLAVVAVQRGDRLSEELRAANAERLSREATTRILGDPVSGAQLALGAWRADPSSPAARSAMLASASAYQDVDAVFPELEGTYGFTGIRDGTVLTFSLSGRHVVIDHAFDSKPAQWQMPEEWPESSLVYGQKWLGFAVRTGGIQIFDIASKTLRRSVPLVGRVLTMNERKDRRIDAALDRGSAGVVLATVDVETGAVTERPLPGVTPDLSQIIPSDDGTSMLQGFQPDLRHERWSRRTIADNPADDVVTPYPEGTRKLGKGFVRFQCDLPPASGQPLPATLQVVPVFGDVPARSIELGTPNCDTTRITADGQWLVEYMATAPRSDRTVVRLTSFGDGSQYQVVLPNRRPMLGNDDATMALRVAPDVTAERDPSGGLTVYAALYDPVSGAELPHSVVVRARAALVPPGSGARQLSADGRFVLTMVPGVQMIVTDAHNGATVGTLPISPTIGDTEANFDDWLWVTTREPTGWVLRRYDLPSLTLMATYPMTGGPEAKSPAFVGRPDNGAVPTDPLVMLVGGLLTAADRQTGARLGPEVTVGSTDAVRARIREAPSLTFRTGHPGQVLIATDDDVQLWDAVAGRQLGTLHVRRRGVAVTRDGARAAVLTDRDTVEVYDLETFQQTRLPIAVSGIDNLAGFDPDGYLVGIGVQASYSISFVDIERGRIAGALAPGTQVHSRLIRSDRSAVITGFYPGWAPGGVPTRAEDWFRHLCTLIDRPYTDDELALLPELIDTAPPCRR